jgi:hypothetical protein
MFFLAFKLFFSNALGFFTKNWRVILIALGLWYCWHLNNARNDAVEALAKYKQVISTASKVAAAKARNDARIISTAFVGITKKHAAELKSRNLDRAKITKELQNEKNNLANLLSDAYRMRDPASGSSAMPENSEPIQGAAESGRDCHATLAIVTRACQITTLDYNAAAEKAAAQCRIMNCD